MFFLSYHVKCNLLDFLFYIYATYLKFGVKILSWEPYTGYLEVKVNFNPLLTLPTMPYFSSHRRGPYKTPILRRGNRLHEDEGGRRGGEHL